MKKINYIVFVLCLLTQIVGVANDKGRKLEQSNQNLELSEYLDGVKHALILLQDHEQAQIDREGSILITNFAEYLQDLGFQSIAVTSEEKKKLLNSVPSLCDVANVKITVQAFKSFFTNHLVEFNTCSGDYFRFTATDTLYNDAFLIDKMHTLWRGLYQNKIRYTPKKRLVLSKKMTNWNEGKLKQYLGPSNVDELEGIYERMVMDDMDKSKYRIAIVKGGGDTLYHAVYLSGATNYEDWEPGELLGTIKLTGTERFFEAQWQRRNKTINKDTYISMDEKKMLYVTSPTANIGQDKQNYYKVFPRNNIERRRPKATGSGIAISSEGYIVTNYHVVQGGSLFEVSIPSEGYLKTYGAVLMVEDQKNDLAILKIDDWDFKKLPDIPYSFKNTLSEVGESVFTLGYPLTGTMGYDIKLISGTVSAQKGFKSDVSCYQVDAEVYKGNSGGPLFDQEARLIGFIKAKHAQAKNITYAIKVRNVLNLIELLPKRIPIPVNNVLEDKSRQNQVKSLQDFVFLIQVIE